MGDNAVQFSRAIHDRRPRGIELKFGSATIIIFIRPNGSPHMPVQDWFDIHRPVNSGNAETTDTCFMALLRDKAFARQVAEIIAEQAPRYAVGLSQYKNDSE